jgi:hypothetical protein
MITLNTLWFKLYKANSKLIKEHPNSIPALLMGPNTLHGVYLTDVPLAFIGDLNRSGSKPKVQKLIGSIHTRLLCRVRKDHQPSLSEQL